MKKILLSNATFKRLNKLRRKGGQFNPLVEALIKKSGMKPGDDY